MPAGEIKADSGESKFEDIHEYIYFLTLEAVDTRIGLVVRSRGDELEEAAEGNSVRSDEPVGER